MFFFFKEKKRNGVPQCSCEGTLKDLHCVPNFGGHFIKKVLFFFIKEDERGITVLEEHWWRGLGGVTVRMQCKCKGSSKEGGILGGGLGCRIDSLSICMKLRSMNIVYVYIC